jgi:hypothetical protein
MAAAVMVAAVPAVPVAASDGGHLVTATTGWRAKTAPVAGLVPPPGVTSANGVFPATVNCPAASSCVSVGSYRDSSFNLHGLIDMLSNGTWSALTAPTAGLNPAASASPGGLAALSCPAAGRCVAVGSYRDQAGNDDGEIDTWANGSWTAQTAPAISGTTNVRLSGVSCPAAGWCVAVGSYENTAGNWRGLTETLASGAWTAATLPSGELSPPPGPVLALGAVSCPAAGWCVASGAYENAARDSHGVIATLAGGAWHALTAPEAGLNPAPGPPGVRLLGVSCPKPGMCAMTGAYVSTSNQEAGLTETLSKGTWTPAAVPGPPDGLSPVACPAANWCVAFGNWFMTTLSGGSWHNATVPTAGLNPAAQAVIRITSVSCPAAGSCVAFGMYTDTSGLEHGFTTKLAHGAWTATTAPTRGLRPPPNPTANPLQPPYAESITTGGIACPAIGACVAVGYYVDTAPAFHGLIESQKG